MERSLIGTSPGLDAVRRAVAQVASTDATVLILGETGSGKELVARAVHEQSRRQCKPLVPVNCVALAPALIASELFGHEAGSFTGAAKRRVGRFEQAEGGTIFLDEIGELAADTQAMLLRTLQERVIDRVGRRFNSRRRSYRRGHQSRIAGRGESRPIPSRPFLSPQCISHHRSAAARTPVRYSRAGGSFGRATLRDARPRHFPGSPEHNEALVANEWPGNVRELQNVIERAVIVSQCPNLAFDPSWLVGMSVAETAKTWASQEKQAPPRCLAQPMDGFTGRAAPPIDLA